MFDTGKIYHLTVKEKFAWIDEISTAFVTIPRYEGGGTVKPGKYGFKIGQFNYPLIRGVFLSENGGEQRQFYCSLKRQAAHGF